MRPRMSIVEKVFEPAVFEIGTSCFLSLKAFCGALRILDLFKAKTESPTFWFDSYHTEVVNVAFFHNF